MYGFSKGGERKVDSDLFWFWKGGGLCFYFYSLVLGIFVLEDEVDFNMKAV